MDLVVRKTLMQRHLSKVLLQLSAGKVEGVAERSVFRKEELEQSKPKQTRISYTTLDEVAAVLESADGKSPGTYSASTLKPRLRALMTPWLNEGFFAKRVVLVEGEEDRAAILGVASTMEYDLDSIGISVIPCMGKTCLDRPVAIFSSLGIPVYAIWDSDFGKKDARPEDNHRLLRLLSEPVQDWPEAVKKSFACFKRNLMDTLRTEIGEELLDSCLTSCCQRFGFESEHAMKNPDVIRKSWRKLRNRESQATP
jgi:hypothetical protein